MERLSDGARRVAGVLNDLMSGDNRKIKDAEEIVNSVGKHPGYIQYLAEIANSSEPQKPDAMRKSAVAVLLANVKEYYIENMGHANSQSTMDQNDREFLRRSILDFVTMNLDCSTVYQTYMEVMTIMIQIDYPHRWQGLLEGLVGKLLNPRNIEDLVGGLLASNCLIKGFERSFEGTQREALEVVLQYIFPLLEKLLTTYMNDLFSSDKDEATKITALRIVTHCISGLSMSLRMRIPRYFMENRDKFSMWMVVVKGLLDRPIHDVFLIKQPQVWREVSDKEEHPEWTVRTLCMKVLFRLSVHMAAEPYGKQEEDFSDEFILRYAKGYFETCFRFLEINLYGDVRKGDQRAVNNMQAGSGEFVAPKVLNLALRSMVNLLELDLVFDVAKVHLERILLDFLIPLLQVNVRDKEFWLEDQVQLVYSEKTPSDDHNMVKNACTDAICAISEMEVDGELLIFRLMNFAAYSLEHCKNARTGHQLNIRERESILRAVQGVSEIILDHKRIVDRLDAFFAKCVVHEMANIERDDGFIRMRALFVYSKLGGVCNFGAHEINVKIAQAVCSGLGVSRDKAVQIAAAEALTALLGHNDMKQMLVGEVNTMLSHLLHLMKEVELDDLVDALEEIVARFSDSISTTAVVDIITELKNIYFQYRPDSNQGEQSDENADEILRAADSCLDTINSLIRSCNQNFPFEHLAGIIFELLNDTLVRTNDEVGFEKCINLLNLLIFKTTNLRDQNMIAYFPLLCYLIIGRPQSHMQIPDGLPEVFSQVGLKKEWAHDLRCLVGCFLNYMNKMGENFLQNKDFYGISFVDLMFKVIQRIGGECIQQQSASNLIYGLRIIMGMLENFPRRSVEFFPTMLDIVLELRKTPLAGDWDLRRMMFQLISAMMWCDPECLIKHLGDRDILGDTLTALLDHIVNFKTETQFEIALLGLGRLYTLDYKTMERVETCRSGVRLHHVMRYCVELCNRVLEFRKADTKGPEAQEVRMDDASKKSSGFFGANSQQQTTNHRDERDEDDSDCESEAYDDEANAFVYESPLDKICPILELRDILEEIKSNSKHQGSKDFLSSRLDPEQYKSLENCFRDADKHRIPS